MRGDIVAAALLGGAVGFVLAVLFVRPGNCCARVGEAVHDRVTEELGPLAGDIFDAVGGRRWSPGFLNVVGA